ncbi:hypothetical protein HOE22_07790 [Candidatus Woesearchaeota archaeon]|jgi:hypothetical protein|nr:hypothetical protein [Candidatus Woesearchaeota archaeon]MBT4733063.1 hypothetical protein [Candidatus Woesearchaeota archaeon]
MKKSVLVIFSKDLPKKSEKWWRQFNTLIAPRQLEGIAKKYELNFIDIGTLIDPGSVEEATELTRKLSLLKDFKGQRISKAINYKSFELWWINYDSLMFNFCLPYTQYRRLLESLVDFSSIYLYKPLFSDLFKHFLISYNCQFIIKDKRRFKKIPPLGVLLQVILSMPFILWTKLRQPKLMLWTSDKFDPPRDHDFRMKFIYEELREKKINFVEFIRSMEKSSVVLRHALKRKRPVVYSYAVATLARFLASIFGNKNKILLNTEAGTEEKFWFLVATNYLNDVNGDIWAIHTIKFILKFIGIKGLIVSAAVNRNFHEILACKLLGIPTIGIQHGASSKNYFVSDFMHEFDGERQLSVDKYGVWSEWWKEYLLKNSKAYRPEQLFVSGPMRPIEKTNLNILEKKDLYIGPIRILFISEELSVPSEVVPYLEALLELPRKDFSFSFRFRPYKDGFKNWLLKNRPDLLEHKNITISGGELQDAIKNNDVVVGSNSTAVLEALFQLKVPILFKTQKWGDAFDIRDYGKNHPFFAEDKHELIEKIKNVRSISIENLKDLLERYFGDPYKNGSKWVVEQAEKNLLENK